ncbi:MAG: T9SS type A sorting domain-containing protein [Bacteroidota bacterium]|nr:T9SS type A sorting domain-containing protein [Bacteroidota bacterium]
MKKLISMLILSMIVIGNMQETAAITRNNNSTQNYSQKLKVNSEPLSDSLPGFIAVQQAEEVQLQWLIASDQVYGFFAIEMSTDGKDYFEIGNIKGSDYNKNPGEYLYIHKQAVSSVLYYRLKLVATDGSSKYSQIVKSESKKAALVSEVKIYPNPVSIQAEVAFTFSENSAYILTISDNSGKVASTQTGTGVAGNNIVQINMENQMSGIYFLYITGANGLSHVSKFIKD